MSTWLAKVRHLRERLESSLYTAQEFDLALQDTVAAPESPVRGLAFEWVVGDDQAAMTVGRSLEGEPSYHAADDELPAKLSIWRAEELSESQEAQAGASSPDIAREAWRCFKAFWLPDERNPKSKLRDFKNFARVVDLTEERFARCRDEEKPCSLIYFDLDNFKQVNDEINESQGDAVIGRFAILLDAVCAGVAVPLHNGGDEFLVLFPGADPEEALGLATAVIDKAQRFNFESGHVTLKVSAGLASYPDVARYESLAQMKDAAEGALKGEVKSKTKGTARFPVVAADHRDLSEQGLRMVVCLIKSSLTASRIRTFANPWLNHLVNCVGSILLSGKPLDSVPAATREFLDNSRLELDTTSLVAQHPRESGIDTEPRMSSLDIGFAIAGGILYAASRDEELRRQIGGVKLLRDAGGVAVKSHADFEIWSAGSVGQDSQTTDLGSCWELAEPDVIDEEAGRVAALVQIGHEPERVADAILAARVIIDDRPTRGGGLPDFWELTLARILDMLESHKNVTKIYVLGEAGWGAKSIEHLVRPAEWDDRFIEYKTALPQDVIERGKGRLAGNVEVVGTADELLKSLIAVVQGPRILLPSPSARLVSEPQRILRRQVNLEAMGAALGPKDGFRARTIAAAYPLALDILRQPESSESPVRDQAGQQLREVVDFKVELTEPQNDQVPAFYASERSELQQYYEDEFRSERGTFSAQLATQCDAVVSHVVDAITALHPFATRRAILVVPHAPTGAEPLAPLGLVSVRCAPRISGRLAVLNFSFVWRTVEALVGFPYSLYGSVQFAHDFTERVRTDMPEESKMRVDMGRVSYVALSLHMFVDDFALNIARRIVNDASE